MKRAKQIAAISAVILLVVADAIAIGFWIPYKRESAAIETIAPLGITVEYQPLFRPLYCNTIRKVLPARHSGACNRVQRIALPDRELSAADWDVLLKATFSFRRLRILDCSDSNAPGELLGALGRSLSDLRQLDLGNTNCSDADVARLHAAELTRLCLNNTSISDLSMRHLIGLQNLQKLQISGTRVTFAGLIPIERLASLRQIDLRNTHLGDGAALLGHRMLQLREVLLAGSDVNDASLERFLHWAPSVEYLDVSNTEVTDACVTTLVALKGVHSLNIRGTRISEESLGPFLKVASLKLLICDPGLLSEEKANEFDVQRPDMIVFAHR